MFHSFSPDQLNGSITQLNRKTHSDHCSRQLFIQGHGSEIVSTVSFSPNLLGFQFQPLPLRPKKKTILNERNEATANLAVSEDENQMERELSSVTPGMTGLASGGQQRYLIHAVDDSMICRSVECLWTVIINSRVPVAYKWLFLVNSYEMFFFGQRGQKWTRMRNEGKSERPMKK